MAKKTKFVDLTKVDLSEYFDVEKFRQAFLKQEEFKKQNRERQRRFRAKRKAKK